MAENKNKKIPSGGYIRDYGRLRGVDFSERGDEGRYSLLENMYVDYEGGGALESIPGFRKICSLGARINGIYSQKQKGEEYLIVHAGTELFRFKISLRDSLGTLTPTAGGIKDIKSSAVSLGESLYLLDGEKITVITPAGGAASAGSARLPYYIPTTHLDGEPYEERNLLTPAFRQKFRMRSHDEYAYGSEGLKYRITDYDKKLCSLIGADSLTSNTVFIPSYATIGGTRFKVTEVGDSALSGNTDITTVISAGKVESLGTRAFSGCTALLTVMLGDSVKKIGEYCFEGCSSLSALYLGKNLSRFGTNSLSGCTLLREIYYAGGEDDMAKVENTAEYEDRHINYGTTFSRTNLEIPIFGPVASITSVTLDGISATYNYTSGTSHLVLNVSNRYGIEGRELTVSGNFSASGDGFLEREESRLLSPAEAILGCTRAAVYDGRLFFTANPALPGFIFYSGYDTSGIHRPLYFSTKNFLYDGGSITSLLANGDRLSAYIAGSSEGSIYIHKAEGSREKRSYPTDHIHRGISHPGESISFMGEDLFVSSRGICALTVNDLGGYSRLACRSEAVAKPLLAEVPENIRLSVWRGYLILSVLGRFYLADSRDRFTRGGDYSYEWYYLSGIGTYSGDSRRFRYLSEKKNGFILSDDPDGIVTEEVFSRGRDDGGLDYFVNTSDGPVAVYPTEEYHGGLFHPAVEIGVTGDLLFFGTDDGNICLFNSDKRGTPPPRVTSEEDFSKAEYAETMGAKIHPYFYDFDRHSVRYRLITPPDSCGLSGLEKCAIPASLSLKFGSLSDAALKLSLITEDGAKRELSEIRTGNLDFSAIDFSSLSFSEADYSSVAVRENIRTFLSKQYEIVSEGFRAPIGECTLSYRYRPSGRIKNK